ncbi:nitroreductase family protein [Fundicoccus culcitae]|uniref:Nitroreductase family protein n=1 Tax=Fundicoccus culcitae TaxID=2969821 RepID=A0ABY5P549_9LACT|nr:nitroreductase family protein [Fundicoccus culcitae]UUX33881.1 nitroreductase family protein [Fundicoccus culcitae]
MAEFKEVVKNRRSIYALGNESDYTVEEIVNNIRETQKDVPSAFNSQTSRLVILTGEANDKFWDLIYNVQKDVLDEATWEFMSPIMVGAKNGIGTVLFFEDRDAVAKMPTQGQRTEAYKQNNSANSQYATWLALADMNLGGSLQHFNVGYEQGFDKAVREMFDLPDSYEMIAQLPFGSVAQPAGEKEYMDSEEQVRLIK